jgi:hypothetical protein
MKTRRTTDTRKALEAAGLEVWTADGGPEWSAWETGRRLPNGATYSLGVECMDGMWVVAEQIGDSVEHVYEARDITDALTRLFHMQAGYDGAAVLASYRLDGGAR